jgi:hypothetical protein
MYGIVLCMTSHTHMPYQPDPVVPEGEPAPRQDLLEGDLLDNTAEIIALFQAQVRREIAEHLAAGHPIFFGGKGDQVGKLYMRTSDGEVREIPSIEAGYNGASSSATR